MRVAEVKLLSPIDRLLFWIRERNQVYLKKRAGKPKPWSENEIFQSVYFTNVYRERDKTTVWFRDQIREPLRTSPDVLFATIAFRWFNLISTGELLKFMGGLRSGNDGFGYFTKWDLNNAITMLKATQGIANRQIFTGAFNISNSGSTKPKINRVCEDYIQPVWEARHILLKNIQREPTLENAHRCLKRMPGLGGSGFMSAQIIADLRHTYLLEYASDSEYWSCVGPGSKRGMNRVFGREVNAPVSPSQWISDMASLRKMIGPRLSKLPPIHAQDLQNCCCEFFKFERALFNLGGHSKRGYNGIH